MDVLDVVESRAVGQDREEEAGSQKVVEALEGKDNGEEFQVIVGVSLLSRVRVEEPQQMKKQASLLVCMRQKPMPILDVLVNI